MFDQKEYIKAWREKNQKYMKEYAKNYYQINKKQLDEQHKCYREAHKKEIKIRHGEYLKKLNINNRMLVLVHYSNNPPKCQCCGEITYEFLTLDHINNDGNIERKKINRKGFGFYCWLIKNNFPSGYQVLCMNCNWGKRMNGICPHKSFKQEQPIDRIEVIA